MSHLFAVLKLALVVGIVAIVLRSPVAAAPTTDPVVVLATQPSTPPNIVLILADHLDLVLETVTTMPHLKALLAGQGVTFSNFFTNASICCPSRVIVARAVRAQPRHTNGPPGGGFETFRDLGLENDTIADVLGRCRASYRLFGKYLNRYPSGSASNYIPAGWNGSWYAPSPTRPGYDQFNYTLNDNGTLVPYGSDPVGIILQDVLLAKAQSFITRTIAISEPFFVYFAAFSPHEPLTPVSWHSTMFTGTIAPRTPSFNELDVKRQAAGNPGASIAERDGDRANRCRVPKVAAIDAGG